MTGDGGQRGYRGDLSRHAVTIAEALRPAGYRTSMSGKWHVTTRLEPHGDRSNWPLQRGFDRFYGTIIGAGSFFDPWTLTRDNRAITPDNDEEYRPGAASWNGGDDSAWEWEVRCMEVYAAMVDSMDQGIGRIVAALEATGRLDNTLILYLQDNGGCAEAYGRKPPKRPLPDDVVPMGKDELQTRMIPDRTRDGRPVRTGPGVMPDPADTYIAYGRNWANVSNTPFREYKSSNHEGGITTPLIAHWPEGIAARNELRHEPGHLIDIMATCIELSGAEYPTRFADHDILPMEGRSLRDGFTADRTSERTLLFEHYGRAAIRKGPWKLVRAGDTRPWELYSIEEDRTELDDLGTKNPETVRELSRLWEQEAERTFIHPKPDGKKKTR